MSHFWNMKFLFNNLLTWSVKPRWFEAARRGDIDTLSLLLSQGIAVDSVDDKMHTALNYAVQSVMGPRGGRRDPVERRLENV